MADQEQGMKGQDCGLNAKTNIPNKPSLFCEETSTEIKPVSLKKVPNHSTVNREETANELAPVSLKKPPYNPSEHREETAAEIAAPVSLGRRKSYEDAGAREAGGTGVGFLALALSIISLFVMPILFGAAGIVLGFVARSKGAQSIGAWAIGIGAVSIIIGIFIIPFF